MTNDHPFQIRPAAPHEYAAIGRVTVDANSALDGNPDNGYAAELADVASRARHTCMSESSVPRRGATRCEACRPLLPRRSTRSRRSRSSTRSSARSSSSAGGRNCRAERASASDNVREGQRRSQALAAARTAAVKDGHDRAETITRDSAAAFRSTLPELFPQLHSKARHPLWNAAASK